MPGRLRGYRPVGGSSRRYRTPGGKTISRREYDNRRAQAVGFRNRYELEKFRERQAGSNWLGDIYEHTGRQPTFQHYADLREVKQRRARIRATGARGNHSQTDRLDPELTAPDGPLARLLDAAGKRPLSGRPVGDS